MYPILSPGKNPGKNPGTPTLIYAQSRLLYWVEKVVRKESNVCFKNVIEIEDIDFRVVLMDGAAAGWW